MIMIREEEVLLGIWSSAVRNLGNEVRASSSKITIVLCIAAM
ncbi:unnamed protein product [Musa acuminata subsp. burmannicoides]